MSLLKRIFSTSAAKNLEKKGDDAFGSRSAIIYYEEAIQYLKIKAKYYEINSIYEKIGKLLLNEARKNENPFIERNRDYEKAYEIFNNINSKLKEETAIEHCILNYTETTLKFYKLDIINKKSMSFWRDFILKLAEKAKSSPEIKPIAKLLVREFLQLDVKVVKPALIQFIKSFNLPDKHEAELYLIVADYYLIPSLDRSDMYKLAGHSYKSTGLLSEWVNAMEGQYMFYLGGTDYNYLIDDDDIYEISKLLGENALKDFFFNIMSYFLSDTGRILTQGCLNKKEYWTIFCKALIKQIKMNGVDSLFIPDSLAEVKEALIIKMEINPDITLKLITLLGFTG